MREILYFQNTSQDHTGYPIFWKDHIPIWTTATEQGQSLMTRASKKIKLKINFKLFSHFFRFFNYFAQILLYTHFSLHFGDFFQDFSKFFLKNNLSKLVFPFQKVFYFAVAKCAKNLLIKTA